MVQWNDIKTSPTLKSIWVATIREGHESGYMEPCYKASDTGQWKNIYTLHPVDWVPTHWQPLPSPPSQTTNNDNGEE